MKRPSGLWILLSAGVLWLSIQDVYGVRGTSLIFGKSTTTTTTTPSAEEKDSSEDEGVTTELSADGNTTKPTLTGNPQIDYIWDPNLPKELNGYNLSDYPFYERVPKDITFKCDGLHDGFYASVQHKCQVYHHCLHETRYDFLCGNYTAFDQRTFICHFASEVDCNNSKKYWHRNDALYKAASTTTVKPIIYTTAPPIQTPTDGLAPPVGSGPRRIRPYRRRRPQYDYYDDYYDFFYEDRPRSRGRKRPRPRPRPIYDDEYEEEYEEERYEKRGGGRRNENRRPYERRPNAGRVRNKERPRLDYEDEDSETKYEDDIELSRRKPVGSKESKSKYYGRRHPTGSESEEQVEKPRPSAEKIREKSKPSPDTRAIIKPVSGTIYDRPRLAPKIRLPVPKNEAEKYAYKPLIPKEPVPQENIEYDDDYVEIEASNYDKKKLGERESNEKPIKKSNPRTSTRKHPQIAENTSRNNTPKRRPKPEYEDYEDDYDYAIDARPNPTEDIMKATPKTSTSTHTKITTTTTHTTPTTTTTTTMAPIEKIEQPLIRLVKRPFLPSRGGNPYSARGLKPVGAKAAPNARENSEVFNKELGNRDNYHSEFTPTEVILDSLMKTRIVSAVSRDNHEEGEDPRPAVPTDNYQRGVDSRQNFQKPDEYQSQPHKLPAKNPLDIAIDEYDITLNDALNPTLPNLPVRGYPTGFDVVNNEYIYNNNNYRPRYPQDQVVATASNGYIYKPKPADQRFEVQTHSNFGNTNYQAHYSPIRENYRPRQYQSTEALYSRY
ncbi:unnamed protein product [Phaedon cochleariae]|uniref:Chitin-binding type-2 domain-containing protein n=1 Tax=Phaedon cochleariae TaxID=80249 RepID=A0A9N9SK13_PHACE|nr:unnamed protein product [Phaedon cochleariae]